MSHITPSRYERKRTMSRSRTIDDEGRPEKKLVEKTNDRARCRRETVTAHRSYDRLRKRTRRRRNKREEFITSICKPLFVTMIVNKIENTVCNVCVPEFYPRSGSFSRLFSFFYFGDDSTTGLEQRIVVCLPLLFLLYVFLVWLLCSLFPPPPPPPIENVSDPRDPCTSPSLYNFYVAIVVNE